MPSDPSWLCWSQTARSGRWGQWWPPCWAPSPSPELVWVCAADHGGDGGPGDHSNGESAPETGSASGSQHRCQVWSKWAQFCVVYFQSFWVSESLFECNLTSLKVKTEWCGRWMKYQVNIMPKTSWLNQILSH